MSATGQGVGATAAGGEQELTDGFHLIIDALKLNDVKTIYAVPGIPITDFLRMSQASGIRVLSFWHEQNFLRSNSDPAFVRRGARGTNRAGRIHALRAPLAELGVVQDHLRSHCDHVGRKSFFQSYPQR